MAKFQPHPSPNFTLSFPADHKVLSIYTTINAIFVAAWLPRYKQMNTGDSRQNLQQLLLSSIQQYFKDSTLDSSQTTHCFKYAFKMVLYDPQFEALFKHLIQVEVQKLNLMRKHMQYSPQEQSKVIRQNIKNYVEGIIQKEWQKYQMCIKQQQNSSQENILCRVNQDNRNQWDGRSQFSHTKTVAKDEGTRLVQEKTVFKRQLASERPRPQKFTDRQLNIKKKTIKKEQSQRRTRYQEKRAVEVIEIESGEQNKTKSDVLRQADSIKESIKRRYLSFLPQKIDRIDHGPKQLKKTARLGHFIYGDKVRAILDSHSQGKDQKGKQKAKLLLIEWQHRSDGFKPQNSILSLKEYEQYRPLQVKLLIKKQALTI